MTNVTRPSPARAGRQTPSEVRRLTVVFGPPHPPTVLGDAPLIIGRAGDLAIDDEQASRQHAVFDAGSVRDLDSTNGTIVDGVTAPPGVAVPLADGVVLRIGDTLLLHEIICIKGGTRLRPGSAPLFGPSVALQAIRGEIERVGPRRVSVLVLGETGVGKERVAEALHLASGRSGPLIPVNCAALPADLIESELFGHVAGAFTGAKTAKRGLFAAAEGGTIFLDEIGDMPIALQPKLLRVLSTGTIRPVGATEPIKVDVRVVAATHQDLITQAMQADRFRGDLYARLAGWILHVPPLRDRRADVLPLAGRFLKAAGADARLSPDAAEALLLSDWPYNVRGLEQAMTAAAVRCESGRIELADLDDALAAPVLARAPEADASEAPPVPIELIVTPDQAPDAAGLRRVLTHFEGNMARVATYFGKDRRQIYRWAERLDVDPDLHR
jgi:DNA-binding NtrC family response regulator